MIDQHLQPLLNDRRQSNVLLPDGDPEQRPSRGGREAATRVPGHTKSRPPRTSIPETGQSSCPVQPADRASGFPRPNGGGNRASRPGEGLHVNSRRTAMNKADVAVPLHMPVFSGTAGSRFRVGHMNAPIYAPVGHGLHPLKPTPNPLSGARPLHMKSGGSHQLHGYVENVPDRAKTRQRPLLHLPESGDHRDDQ